jgi:uncharacterized protein involved in type VI secretion and phage assembly
MEGSPHGTDEVATGIYTGVVCDARDPGRGGRVQVMVPLVLGETYVWARIARQGRRTSVPAIGDTVVVAFEAGDTTRPIVLGVLPDSM